MAFHIATRKGTKVLVGLTGLSGTGKTYSAIKLARGLAGPSGKIVFIDTENGRGSLYASLTSYMIDELWSPFSPARYIEKVKEALSEKPDVLVLDSISHEWEGTGGVLEMAEAGGKKGLAKWMAPKTAHKKFVNLLLQATCHVVVCLRGKVKLVQVGSDIVNQGIVPVQEGRLLYEMTLSLVFDELSPKGVPTLSKCPSELLPAFPKGQPISEKTGEQIAAWVGVGAPVDHELVAHQMAGREAADEGTEPLKAWWNGLPKMSADRKSVLKAMLDGELKSIASTADARIASSEPDESEPKPTDTSILDDSKPTDEPEIAKWGT